MDQQFYRNFEDRFRGSREIIKERLQCYSGLLEALSHLGLPKDLIDLGCGRMEWLELTALWGWHGTGVDTNSSMANSQPPLGFQIRIQDALQYLSTRSECDTTLISGFHITEHLCFDEIDSLLRESYRILRPGGILILELPNPKSGVSAFSNFHLDPTHMKPIPPELLSFSAEFHGFKPVYTLFLNTQESCLRSPATFGNLVFGASPDYAIIGSKPATESSQMQENTIANSLRYLLSSGLSVEGVAQLMDSRLVRDEAIIDDLAKRILRLERTNPVLLIYRMCKYLRKVCTIDFMRQLRQ